MTIEEIVDKSGAKGEIGRAISREAAQLATEAERERLKEKLDAAERLAEAVEAIVKEAAEDEGLDQAYFAGDDLVDALANFRAAGKETP